MPSKRAKELWESGFALSRAWLEFAPPELRSEFEQLPELSKAVAAISDAEIRDNPIPAMAEALKNGSTRMQLERELKEHLLIELFNGELLATGYRISPSRSQAPVLIDPDKFEHDDPDWTKDTLDAQGVKYGRIKVCSPGEIQRISPPANGSMSAIEAAVAHLIEQNPDFCNLPRKSACQKIRDYLGARLIAGNGMSDKNLAKFIVRKCGQKRISRN